MLELQRYLGLEARKRKLTTFKTFNCVKVDVKFLDPTSNLKPSISLDPILNLRLCQVYGELGSSQEKLRTLIPPPSLSFYHDTLCQIQELGKQKNGKEKMLILKLADFKDKSEKFFYTSDQKKC